MRTDTPSGVFDLRKSMSKSAIFAFFTRVGIALLALTQFNAKPLTKTDSFADLPCAFRMLIALILYFGAPLESTVCLQVRQNEERVSE